jgi:putative oxygen-independent coproporphyrinogen III oxidase
VTSSSVEEPVTDPLAGPGPTSLYVHVPFCESKCSYCDFYSVPAGGVRESRYVDALAAESEMRTPAGFAPRTVFVGGGTPTALEDDDFVRMLELVRGIASPGGRLVEWTVEANPGSITPEKARALAAAGVTRISLGVQSFDDAVLRSVGRVHDARTAREAVAIARGSGVPTVSLDLLFAIPGQGLGTFERDLAEAVALGTDHVSAYALLYEHGTAMTRRHDAGLVDREEEDIELTMMRRAREVLGAAGFRRYEISNFARPARECLHNVNYWRNGEYLGLGASAASYLGGERRTNVASWRDFEAATLAGRDPVVFRERLGPDDAMGEEVMLRLRMAEGMSLAALTARWGRDARRRYDALVRRFAGAGLLDVTDGGDRVAFSERGLEVADGVLAEFLAA